MNSAKADQPTPDQDGSMNRRSILVCTALAFFIMSAPAWSQQFPCESAKLVVPWARGGSTDVIYRTIAASANNVGAPPRLQIVNVSGQGGAKGTKQVQKAKPDGCTLLAIHQSIMTSHFIGRLKFSWDAFDPIALLTTTPAIVGASMKTPYDDIPGLVAAAKRDPGTIITGSSLGSTSHFLLLMLEHAADVRFVHFNYNGDRERITALLNGDIAIGEVNFAAARRYIDENRLKALGISTAERNPQHPGVMTLKEQGVDVVFSTDRGVVVPKGTPALLTRQLETIFARAVRNPKVIEQLAAYGTAVKYLNRKNYRKYLADTYAEWEDIAIGVGMFKR
jgi:tripartite-type tricarboxylate transporter receptor subunit TctC